MTDSAALRVLIADDHEGFRHELRQTLEHQSDMRVVAEASNGADASRRACELWPHGLDLVLMDIDMPLMNGIDATREIHACDPHLPIIILTVSTLECDLFDGISSGAIGFLNKNLSPACLTRTLRDFCSNGSLPMSRAMAGKVVPYLQAHNAVAAGDTRRTRDTLSEREREILARISTGAHDREIAATLFVSESTIKTHVRRILRKLSARNRAEAAARLERWHL